MISSMYECFNSVNFELMTTNAKEIVPNLVNVVLRNMDILNLSHYLSQYQE